MAKRIYQLGEHCDDCGTPTVQGKDGAYCKACYIKWKNAQNAMQPSQGGYAPNPAQNAPQRNFWASGGNPAIERAVAHKDEGIAYTASIRDAVLLTVAEMNKDINVWDEQKIKERVAFWQKYMYTKQKAPFYSI